MGDSEQSRSYIPVLFVILMGVSPILSVLKVLNLIGLEWINLFMIHICIAIGLFIYILYKLVFYWIKVHEIIIAFRRDHLLDQQRQSARTLRDLIPPTY